MRRQGLFVMAVSILTAFITAWVNVRADSPTNGQFQILSLQPTFDLVVGSNAYVITWNAAPGLVNHLTYADSLDASWQNIVGMFATNGAITMVATDYPPAAATQRLYRVRASPRSSLVMSLVLDRSGSMWSNGGYLELPIVVSEFISLFDDTQDHVAMVSFSSAAHTDVAMEQPFKMDILNALSALFYTGYTCSDQGLTNALAQNDTLVLSPGEHIFKTIVFFTDGMANTFAYNFDCGPRNISYQGLPLYDPVTGNPTGPGCTIPTKLSSIDPSTGTLTSNAVLTSDCVAMHAEAENRAERIAWLARSQGNTIYCIGLGIPGFPGECGGSVPTLNPIFLKNVANTPDSATYDPTQPSGLFVNANDAVQLEAVFQTIAQQLLSQ